MTTKTTAKPAAKKANPTQAQVIKQLRAKLKDTDKVAHDMIDMYLAEGKKVSALRKELEATAQRLETVLKLHGSASARADLLEQRLAARDDEIARLEASENLLVADKARIKVTADIFDLMHGRKPA